MDDSREEIIQANRLPASTLDISSSDPARWPFGRLRTGSLSLPDPTSACRNGQDRPSNPSMAGTVGLDWHADKELARLSDALRPGTETLDGK